MLKLKQTEEVMVQKWRQDFPILKRKVRDQPLVYLDNAATSQKPDQVIDAISDYYRRYNANVHRGVHRLAEEATMAYEDARKRVAGFIGAEQEKEIVFVRNTTEAINLVAYSWAGSQLEPGDEILLSEMEHHSNLIPWQRVAQEQKVELKFVPVTKGGRLDMNAFGELLSERTGLVTVSQMSNVLGTINPVEAIVEKAHDAGALVLVDGAQSVPHFPVNVQALGVDFLVFSSHKMLGPTGLGVLYARRELLESMPPFMGGGEMIKRVEWREATWNDVPYKFEAGTPNIAQAVGLGAAVDYLERIGMDVVFQHEQELAAYALQQLADVPGVTTYGPPTADQRGGVVSFNLENVHAHDLASMLDDYGIAVRAGHHCAQPLMRKLGTTATARASFYFYNLKTEIDYLSGALREIRKVFG